MRGTTHQDEDDLTQLEKQRLQRAYQRLALEVQRIKVPRTTTKQKQEEPPGDQLRLF
jgi:hypothetical protein